jgi:hypothetical protein
MDCAAKHREFGAVVTLVRSLNLDGWNARQIAFMQEGGNDKLRVFVKKNAVSGPFDYKGPLAKRYKDNLESIVNKKLAGASSVQVLQEVKEKSEFDEFNEKPKVEAKEPKEETKEAPETEKPAPAKVIIQKKQFNVTFNS